MLPKITAPLAKAARTSEGILLAVTAAAAGVGSAIDPSKLPPKEAAIVASALAGLHAVTRTTLKVVAVQKGVGVGAPIPTTISVGSGSEVGNAAAGFVQWGEAEAKKLRPLEHAVQSEAEQALHLSGVIEPDHEDPLTVHIPVTTDPPPDEDSLAKPPVDPRDAQLADVQARLAAALAQIQAISNTVTTASGAGVQVAGVPS
jgi:hypothetical protein